MVLIQIKCMYYFKEFCKLRKLICNLCILHKRHRLFQPIKKPGRTLSIFKSMAFVKDAKGISFKNRFKGHINWRKVRSFNVI